MSGYTTLNSSESSSWSSSLSSAVSQLVPIVPELKDPEAFKRKVAELSDITIFEREYAERVVALSNQAVLTKELDGPSYGQPTRWGADKTVVADPKNRPFSLLGSSKFIYDCGTTILESIADGARIAGVTCGLATAPEHGNNWYPVVNQVGWQLPYPVDLLQVKPGATSVILTDGTGRTLELTIEGTQQDLVPTLRIVSSGEPIAPHTQY